MEVACERGQSYPFEAGKTALLCIDYQRDFLTPEGMCAARGLPIGNLTKVIEPARQAQRAARSHGLAVLHLRECYSPDLSDLNRFRTARDTIIGEPGPLGRFLVNGEAGTRIIDELAPIAGEPIIDKAGFSGFYRTQLDALLQERGITHLVLMGITSQCCVASTLRAAVDHGYFPLVLEDCCAAYEPLHHEATIDAIFSENHQFGWVSNARRFVTALGGSR